MRQVKKKVRWVVYSYLCGWVGCGWADLALPFAYVPRADCIARVTAAVKQACSGTQSAEWQVVKVANALCHGKPFGLGDGTLQSVMGSASVCPGSSVTPREEGWSCAFTISQQYAV